jgi:hypothetical protein
MQLLSHFTHSYDALGFFMPLLTSSQLPFRSILPTFNSRVGLVALVPAKLDFKALLIDLG